ncbi:winged helix-turn-helix domain-containing protein [Methylobacterium sp. J-048]|uniref:winged helix-turn-helix domain-containing protein n=1 Tax=Methylobacterium sp. J-048 TaxID=2836635 RepID=UPI001FB9C076|nr:winged helix-turn-helix domain-containing protein [Methylobacterium sp. J-048]MCJ2057234.1 winged helix-turn-helix domain-containing protein [Methylobacterium sp. J-048]
MGLSEDEIEARLATLRRQREALDREIADLVLYLELGRRLSGAGRDPAVADRGESGVAGRTAARPASEPRAVAARDIPVDTGPPYTARLVSNPVLNLDQAGPEAWDTAPPAARPLPLRQEPDGIPPAIAFTEDAAGARRYGRALVEAACGAILEAGRPLHAGEILEILLARGFTLPGRDPVAALNTRLWKRAGAGGPLRRVAEATYALAGEADAWSDQSHDPEP